jgi:3-hydroxy-9,10-secoandrosta-1,3,5(10)-triene-9,17-dione monooxygenase reductase component
MDTQRCDPDHFRKACSKFPTGVTVTTVMGDDGQPYGITLNSFVSVSLYPPMVLVCIDSRSQMMPHMAVGRCFGINILNHEQKDLSIRFSRCWEERFVSIDWHPGLTGVPVLCDVPAVFECRVESIMPAGDHCILLSRVLHAASNDCLPLLCMNRSYGTIARTL